MRWALGQGCALGKGGSTPGPPAPHLRVGDFRGLLSQAAALGLDEVVVLGDILVRVVQAARAGPGRGPRESEEGGLSGGLPSNCPGPGRPR